MKTYMLAALLGLIAAGPAAAQTFTNLYPFTVRSASVPFANSDGAYPYDSLVSSGGTLYGTAGNGGSAGAGTVFAINTDGTGFTNLHNFSATLGFLNTNAEGAEPLGNLILAGDTMYGTAFDGGASGYGAVFALSTNGTGFTNLHSFAGGSLGANPAAGLVLSGNALYGTAEAGGNPGHGTIFRIYTDGTGFTNLHAFTGGRGGAVPEAGLIMSGDTLYGTTSVGGGGGNGGNGIVFALNTNGTGFTNLHSFNGSNEGAFLQSGLVLSGDTLYGTAEEGGVGDNGGSGTVFSLTTNGESFAVLHTFPITQSDTLINSDGANPSGTLILSGNTLYGTTDVGGAFGDGAVFAVETNGSNFVNLHSFTGGAGGAEPQAGLVLAGDYLYGTTEFAGSGGTGTLFGLSVAPPGPPALEITSISLSGSNVVINASGGQYGGVYKTLTSLNLALPLSQWTPVATNVLIASGDFTITAINVLNLNDPQRFFVLQLQ